MRHLIGSKNDKEPLTKINITEQFRQEEENAPAVVRNLNAAFLIALSGKSHPSYEQAEQYLNNLQNQTLWKDMAGFYNDGLTLIYSEIANICSMDKQFEEKLNQLYSWIIKPENRSNHMETINNIWNVFFPEGVSLYENKDEKISLLREKRKVSISRLNPLPIKNTAREILFTSNILLTIPPHYRDIDDLPINSFLREQLKQIVKEDQLYWYDHPIQIGVETENNEAIYGLRGLEEAVKFEQQHGTIEKDTRLNCVLSVSVTHEGLQRIAKEYLEEEFKKGRNIQHINVYMFTEADTSRLINEILIPAAKRYMGDADYSLLHEIIGVDGEYGRHYSFLKSIAAFWHVFISPEVKGTFKIDLDQVFPQRELVEQSDASTFEHLKTPLWGAEGIDSQGNKVELGMIAGALVNERDIVNSLFTPDVCFPTDEIKGDELIFFSSLPQAISTEAEMMLRYTDDALDGKNQCIHRIHVTGGTCGILVDSLRKYRPFTPTFIGRAEDQAYILSVIFKDPQKNLRYVHKDGLIMRHDKETFAKEAMKSAYIGKLIGDYARILWFSYYARALPWSLDEIKSTIDPFTGCFVSPMPFTVVYRRLSLKAASFFVEDKEEKNHEGFELLQMGTKRLYKIIQNLVKEPNPLIEKYQREKQGWDIYYDILNDVENGLQKGDTFALKLQKKAKILIDDCKIKV